MAEHRKIKIIVEKHRVLTLRTRRTSALGWCVACATKVQMVTAEDASRIAQVTPRTIYRWAEARQIHFTESQDGLLLICPRSLFASSTLEELSADNEKE